MYLQGWFFKKTKIICIPDSHIKKQRKKTSMENVMCLGNKKTKQKHNYKDNLRSFIYKELTAQDSLDKERKDEG